MTWVAGADGFKRGWRVVLCEIESDTWTMRDVAAFSELLKLREAPAIVCVDMPIGLHEHTPPGGRECERLRRLSKLFGGRRHWGARSPLVPLHSDHDSLSEGSG
jgi:predicted RNase H-like nuclease